MLAYRRGYAERSDCLGDGSSATAVPGASENANETVFCDGTRSPFRATLLGEPPLNIGMMNVLFVQKRDEGANVQEGYAHSDSSRSFLMNSGVIIGPERLFNTGKPFL